MFQETFKTYRGGIDRASASDLNARARALEAVLRSGLSNSFLDSTGIHTRSRNPSAGFFNIKIMEVQSEALGDGIYNCYEQTLDATEWHDTDGDTKVDDKWPIAGIEVLNLAEFNPEATYVAHLRIGDLIAAWRMADDEYNDRWIGVPFRQTNADRTRIAYCKEDAGVGNVITCYLDKDETGTEIAVHCSIAQGGTALNAAVPRLKGGDMIFVQKIYDGTDDFWYCETLFNPSVYCVCS